jgi:hypothetical protein
MCRKMVVEEKEFGVGISLLCDYVVVQILFIWP